MKGVKFQLKAMDVTLFFLAIHLFSVNVRLFYHLNPDAIQLIKVVDGVTKEYLAQFSWANFTDQNFISSIIFAVPYSIITVIAIKMLKLTTRFKIVQFLPFFYLAVLDGIGTKLYYMVKYGQDEWDKFFNMGSNYYMIYTFTIVAVVGLQKVWGVTRKDKIVVEGLPTLKPEELLNFVENEISHEIVESKRIKNNIVDSLGGKAVPGKEVELILGGIDNNGLEENIVHLFNSKRFIQREIAEILATSESKVTRVLKEAGLK